MVLRPLHEAVIAAGGRGIQRPRGSVAQQLVVHDQSQQSDSSAQHLLHLATHQPLQSSVTTAMTDLLSVPQAAASAHATSRHVPQPPGGRCAKGLLLLSMEATVACSSRVPNPQAPPLGE